MLRSSGSIAAQQSAEIRLAFGQAEAGNQALGLFAALVTADRLLVRPRLGRDLHLTAGASA